MAFDIINQNTKLQKEKLLPSSLESRIDSKKLQNDNQSIEEYAKDFYKQIRQANQNTIEHSALKNCCNFKEFDK
ncbi:hypothetical protein LS71_008360 [Helicobacter jaachi]|uniref:Uncharacterized protein n=1 Tax=Helicobacter jaachi TaxID=1677920 RepID=A0A4U8T6Z6_9HELI|nr:hypothetical protein [Helicobacter jaachi]TLD95410.1 hypothetical protein LS71_008360 [Helicobacter jaachi]